MGSGAPAPPPSRSPDCSGNHRDSTAKDTKKSRGDVSRAHGNLGWKVHIDRPNDLICRFCGGKSCKREDWTRQDGKSAIRGLHSDW
eukprot:679501-Amorphochlora_amoeboformis.AAC.1